MKHYDLVIIGSGSGLMVLEAALAKGLACAIVEQGKFGGTCLTRGCIPSKVLVYPADFIREAEESERFGIRVGKPTADWGNVAARMWKQIDQNQLIAKSLRQTPMLDVYEGTGAFTGSHTLRVSYMDRASAEEFTADRFVVAAGARSSIPPIQGLEETGYVTSESFFGDRFPAKPWDSVVIIGGGAIGAEFAHIFSAFGSQVTIVEMKPRLIATEEEEISKFVERQFVRHGIQVFVDHKVAAVTAQDGKKILIVENSGSGEQTTIDADEIFVASGVRSNGDLLHVKDAGIETDSRGWIVTNPFLETSQSHIFAIGDINGKYQFRHKANYEAEILVHNLFSGLERKEANYTAVPWAIFTWPQVGHVGLTENEARQKGLRVWVGINSYADIAAGIAMGFSAKDSDNGFVKIIVGEDNKILGAHVVGPQAAVLVQPFVYMMNAGCQCEHPEEGAKGRLWFKIKNDLREACWQTGTLKPMMESMVIHPSLNELTAWALGNVDWDRE